MAIAFEVEGLKPGGALNFGQGTSATLSSTTPAAAAVSTGAVGTGTTAARADHAHALSPAIRGGNATLSAGTVTVTDTNITSTSVIVVTPKTLTPGAGNLTVSFSVPTRTNSTSFVIRANLAAGTINNLDTSNLDWAAIG